MYNKFDNMRKFLPLLKENMVDSIDDKHIGIFWYNLSSCG